jgi:hypothetical protein
MSVSADDDHTGISQEVVWWEATPDLPFSLLHHQTFDPENLMACLL